MADAPTALLAEAAAWLARSRLAGVLLFLFVGVEFLNFGVLPAVLQTVETRTAQQKTETAQSMAAAAKRLQLALARKEAGDARHKEQVAANSPIVLAAKTTVAQQQGTINAEKAKQEDRRAAAEAEKNAAEAKTAQIQGAITEATTRATFIKERADAIDACYKAYMLSKNGREFWEMATGNAADRRAGFVAVRKSCVPEDDTPPAQLRDAEPMAVFETNPILKGLGDVQHGARR